MPTLARRAELAGDTITVLVVFGLKSSQTTCQGLAWTISWP